ncbi:hypothetical protein Dimus_008690 [Dionaea muscipula]
MEFEFDKYCKVVVTGESPRTVLPSSSSRHKSEFKLEKKKLREKASRCMNNEQLDQLRLRRNYYDPSVVSCKSLPSSNCHVDLEGKQVLKRSHVDQSRFQGLDNSNNNNIGCRKKIEYSLAGDSSFSFSILDSICGSDQEEDGGGGGGGGGGAFEEKRSSVTTSPYWSTTACSSNSSRESSSRSRDCLQDHPMRRASSKSNALLVLEQQQQRDAFAFSKSQSSKHASPSSSPTQAEEEEGYYFHKTGLKSRFSPFRKMFGPITKSKSLRSPLSSPSVEEDMMMRLAQRPASILRNDKKMLRKSLLNDFSSTVMDYSSFASMKISEQQQQQEESQSVNVACRCSPAHLHGILKLNHKHGAPYFEFSVKHPEEFLAAKTWKAEDTFSWVYTFHSLQSRKKSSHSSTTGWGIKCSNNKDSPPIPMVGQMQVFSYLGLGLKDEGDLMVSEFVLYDILYAKRGGGGGGGGVAAEEKSALSPSKVCSVSSARGITELDDLFDSVKLKQNTNNGHDRGRSGFSTPYPFAPVDLHPSTEIGAIVVQVPIENRETLKYKKGDKLDTISSPTKELAKIDGTSAVKVNAITTMGNHGLPSNESSGPSPLLDRWRSGGGCDCGGWDMACPLLVFDTITPKVQYGTKGHSLLGSQEPFQLSVKGAKEKIPSLSITATEKGQYSIDFHAHLSSLQAFAICVAILHASDAWSSSTDQEKKETTLLEASDLQVRNDDEVKILVKAFADEEETRKVRKSRKATVENIPSFIVNPPFSPVARV